MIYLKEKQLGRLWIAYMTAILKNGVVTPDNVENILECPPIFFEVDDYSDSDAIIERFARPHIIDVYTRKMFSRELIMELNSTYGDRLFDNLGVDQIDLAVKKLKDNRWAKSCFIPLVVPNDPGPRTPCLSAIQISIRNEKLQIHATFRSQNAFNSYGNILGLRSLGKFVGKMMSLELGSVFYSVNFPHIYESDVAEAERIVGAV